MALKARAALEGKTVEQIATGAIRAHLATLDPVRKIGTLRDLRPESYPPGTENLSEEIDGFVYGA